MKVLQLGKFYPIRGGVEKVMWNLAKGLSETGTDCDMLCARLPGSGTDAADMEYLQPDGSFQFNPHGRVFCVKAVSKVAGTMISPAMIRWLRRRRKDYDIIHVHHPDPMAALALLLSGFRGTVILHWHSDIVSQKTLMVFYKPLQSWLVKRADKIVGTTPVYIESSPYLRGCQDKCTYVPIGIQPIRYSDAGAKAIRDRFPGKTMVLSIGRLVPYKGFPYLVKAMTHLPDSYHLVIGGMGPMKEELESLVEKEGLQRKVTLEGYLPDETLPDYFGACDIFVLSSIMKTEAFGIVQIEAMSCGRPVVATRIPESGVSWVNEDGVSGKNVAPCDSEALAAAIEEVASDYQKYSRGALGRFASVFDEPKMITSIQQIYEMHV